MYMYSVHAYYSIIVLYMQWLENGFLKYLDNWEAYALSKEGISTKEREKLTLSKQTKEGLKIIGTINVLANIHIELFGSIIIY